MINGEQEKKKKLAEEFDEKLDRFRRSRPELGRLRLIYIILCNWPTVVLAGIAKGNRLVRSGYAIPTAMFIFSIGGAFLVRHFQEAPFIWFLAVGAFLLCAIGTWAVFGVITSVFGASLSESVLARLHKLVEGVPCKKSTIGDVCTKAKIAALALGQGDDARFFDEAGERVKRLEKQSKRRLDRLKRTIKGFRSRLFATQKIIGYDCLVRNLTQLFMTFVGTIFCFSMLCHAGSFIDSKSFGDETGQMKSFITAIYFSFTTVTTTDFGDICPVTDLFRMIAVWEQCFGVAFMIGIIGAAVQIFQDKELKDTLSHFNPAEEEKMTRRVFSFAFKLLKDYDRLSAPRHEIDMLLDMVEKKAMKIAKDASKIGLEELKKQDKNKNPLPPVSPPGDTNANA